MSRIGNRVIMIPEGVTVEVNDGMLTVTGPKGSLSKKMPEGISLENKDNQITLTRASEDKKMIHGTINSLLTNMIVGVSKGYEKVLQIVGVGYRFNVQGQKLVISAGYSHPVEMQIPEGLTGSVKDNTELTLKGIDKELIGEFAAQVRKVRKPEPYKGKGIRYADEHIRRKEGKKAA